MGQTTGRAGDWIRWTIRVALLRMERRQGRMSFSFQRLAIRRKARRGKVGSSWRPRWLRPEPGREADVGSRSVCPDRDADRSRAVASRGATHRSDPCGRPQCRAIAGIHASGSSRRGCDARRCTGQCPHHNSRGPSHALGGGRRDAGGAAHLRLRGGLSGQASGRRANRRRTVQAQPCRTGAFSASWRERAEDFLAGRCDIFPRNGRTSVLPGSGNRPRDRRHLRLRSQGYVASAFAGTGAIDLAHLQPGARMA
jgi:hypothetical protein